MDITRIKKLAGLKPVVESWSGKDFSRFMRKGADLSKMTMEQLKDEYTDIKSVIPKASPADKVKLQEALSSVVAALKKKHSTLKEAWGDDEDLNDYERNQGLDFGGDDEDGDVAVSDDPEDGIPDMPGRVQSRDDAKRASHAIAAMRRPAPNAPPAMSDADVGDDVAGDDESTPDADPAAVAAGDPAVDKMSPDVSVPGTEPALAPGVGANVQAPPAAGGDTAGAAMARGQKVAKAREYLGNFKTASRKDFMTYAAKELQMGPHYANTLFYALKKKMVEFFVVTNPLNGKVLAEHSAHDIPVWTSFEKASLFNPGILTQNQAKAASENLARFGHVSSIVKKSIDEGFETVSESNQGLIGKTVKFKSQLTERVGKLTAIEGDRAYFLDKEDFMWSAPVSDLKA